MMGSGVEPTLDVALCFRFDQRMADIDVRPVGIDKLVKLPQASLASRAERIATLLTEYEEKCSVLKVQLEESQRITRFLHQEKDAVELAGRLQREEIVRVVCPTCKGSGMKPTETTGGQLHKKTAFETIGSTKAPTKEPEIAPADRCTDCDGKKWTLMERFKG